MLNIVVAPDKFKGSLTAEEVCSAVREGLLRNHADARILSVPLADGGEGTFRLLTSMFKSSVVSLEVADPLFEPIHAQYGISADGHTAFIEMATASGLQLVEPRKRNPLFTTTLGTGQIIVDALNRGVRRVILGIGGSATNDAGLGMAHALGYEFFDDQGVTLAPVGENLLRLCRIEGRRVHPRLPCTEFVTLCDVDNPLHGRDGAAFVFGPQKGASQEIVAALDRGLIHFEKVASEYFGKAANFPGAGAAGGLGAGAALFLGARLQRGIDYMVGITALREKIRTADLVITGEGKVDEQSLGGKVVMEVVRMALSLGKKVVVVCGKNDLTDVRLQANGVNTCLSLQGHFPGRDTMIDTSLLLAEMVAEKIMR